jgi:hypothetical protein
VRERKIFSEKPAVNVSGRRSKDMAEGVKSKSLGFRCCRMPHEDVRPWSRVGAHTGLPASWGLVPRTAVA